MLDEKALESCHKIAAIHDVSKQAAREIVEAYLEYAYKQSDIDHGETKEEIYARIVRNCKILGLDPPVLSIQNPLSGMCPDCNVSRIPPFLKRCSRCCDTEEKQTEQARLCEENSDFYPTKT